MAHKLTLQIGMRVLIKNNTLHYQFDAGKVKKVTSHLPNFGSQLAYGLDGDDGIWTAEDFVKCIDYPNKEIKLCSN